MCVHTIFHIINPLRNKSKATECFEGGVDRELQGIECIFHPSLFRVIARKHHDACCPNNRASDPRSTIYLHCSINTRNIHDIPVHIPSKTPLKAPVKKTVACEPCETTESMAIDTAVVTPVPPRTLEGLLRQAGTKEIRMKKNLSTTNVAAKSVRSQVKAVLQP